MSTRSGVLAIDHGTKRTGFAAVDPLRIAPVPLDAFSGTGDGPELLAHIAKLLDERTIGILLVGLPRHADGSEGVRAADVRAFAARLATRFPDLPVVLHDEHLTTKAAEELLRDAGTRRADWKGRRDSLSALVLLRDWLESGEPREPVSG
ncbi:MAG: Holliday junction resolvase RuvX [Planctomycetota bacterium]|nr:Holliday junction resolvase RuvX [Planctomycetota bacterium]